MLQSITSHLLTCLGCNIFIGTIIKIVYIPKIEKKFDIMMKYDRRMDLLLFP